MCSIMCYVGTLTEKESEAFLPKFTEGFEKTKSRGPDMSEVLQFGSGVCAFHRLAIMDLDETGMQPFCLDGSYSICNGELYGFRKMKRDLEAKGYAFTSDSDCEIVLPLYREYGTKIFALLDAEFAMVIYDAQEDSFIAARDPIGIRPLYYGYTEGGAILFASEPKNIQKLTSRVMPFPPGHYYKDGQFYCYCDPSQVDLSAKAALADRKLPEICDQIRDKLIKGVQKRLDADAPLGFLLSGGLDSSLVCAIAQKLMPDKPIRTFAIGMSEDAIDLKYAKEAADFIGSVHTEFIITKEDVLESLETVIEILGTYDITTIRASMGMYLLCKKIRETTDVRVLLTGEISDELFGYKYTDFAPDADAFQEESAKRIRELHMYDVLRADRCISANSIEARVPFGDLVFVRTVMAIDPAKKMNTYGKGKYLLRKAFEGDDYLPETILWREKAAFSDAVGHSLVDHLKEYAEGRYSDEELESGCQKYSYHATPFTKESLMYREIFEKYYPGQAEMIAGFWMPNKSWEGCDVSDPSARVLSNYGDSGK